MAAFKAENNPKSGSFRHDVLNVRIVRFCSLLFCCSKCSYCSEVIRA